MRIGELAQTSGTPIETIRFYEREGLLPAAARTEGNYRIYTPQHADRLGFIRQCRSLDMTLDEVRVLLRFKDQPLADCGEVNSLLDEHIGHQGPARLGEGAEGAAGGLPCASCLCRLRHPPGHRSRRGETYAGFQAPCAWRALRVLGIGERQVSGAGVADSLWPAT